MARILIVDDQECIREVVSEELSSEGYQVTMAGDAESVKGHLRFFQPDLVLLDLYLDGPDGIPILHDLKRQYPGLPVIIFTAYDSYMEDPRLCEADGYVIKSCIFDELKEAIALVLAESSACGYELEGHADHARVGVAVPP
jgi:two-component system response regulator (stage 0 sporulation protein F)